MIDQGKHVDFAREISHASGLGGIHGHRFFAKHSLALFESGQRDFHVRRGRRDDAYEIDIVPGDQFFPITSYMFDAKLLRDLFGMFTMAARNRHYPGAPAMAKAGILGVAAKAAADMPVPDGFVVPQFFQPLSRMISYRL